jgi:hypothetical protein
MITSFLFVLVTLVNSVDITALFYGTPKRDVQSRQADFQTLVTSKLGPFYTVTYNSAQSHALCEPKTKEDHARRKHTFIVVRLVDNAVIKEGTYTLGYVKWISDTTLEVYSEPMHGRESKKMISINSTEQ